MVFLYNINFFDFRNRIISWRTRSLYCFRSCTGCIYISSPLQLHHSYFSVCYRWWVKDYCFQMRSTWNNPLLCQEGLYSVFNSIMFILSKNKVIFVCLESGG